MKKYIQKMFLIMLPVILWCILFVAFEPYNYWGLLQTDRTSTTSMPLARMRKAMRDGYENILLGDSRTSHFHPGYIEKATGIAYCNLGFGGATLQEEIDLFWWAAERQPVKKVMLQTGFWTINESYNLDRINALKDIADNPMRFISTMNYHTEALKQMKEWLKNAPDIPPVYTDEERAENKRYYAEKIIYPGVKDFRIDWDRIAQLKEIAEYCSENDIEFVVILPPLDSSIWDLVIAPLGLEKQMNEYKQAISQFAVVYDMEYPEMDAYPSAVFDDGFHLTGLQELDCSSPDTAEKYPAIVDYVDQMYNGKTDHMHIWQDGHIINP